MCRYKVYVMFFLKEVGEWLIYYKEFGFLYYIWYFFYEWGLFYDIESVENCFYILRICWFFVDLFLF